MRHTKLLAAVIFGVSTFGVTYAHEQGIVVGEPVVEAAPELPPAAVAGEIPGGLTDSAWKIAYVIGENGHTEAVDLKTGATKFASATPAVPLGVQGDTLYVLTCKVDPIAQAAEVVVRGMSVSGQGKYTFESKKIPISEWLTTSYGSSITATAKIEGGKMTLTWLTNMDAYATAMGGKNIIQLQRVRLQQQAAFANGPANIGQNPGVTISEIDLKTGEVKAIEKKEKEEQPAADDGEDFPTTVTPGILTSADMMGRGQRVTRDGNIYALADKSGQAQMSCQRIEDRRLLWVHPINTSRVLKTGVMAPEKPPEPLYGFRGGLREGCW